jgi:hypothetical protein
MTFEEAIAAVVATVFISGALFLICVAVIAYEDSKND